MIKNQFTGEPLVKIQSRFEEKRTAATALRKKESEELWGAYDRPKSRGRTYDLPRFDETYCEDQVDQEGGQYDLNAIMKRLDPDGKKFNQAIKSGLVTDAGMLYGDFTDANTLQEALNVTLHAEQQFEALPVELRNRFENNPTKFLEYIHDPKYLEEQYNLGIRVKPVVPEKDATLKDVITAVKETAKPPKKAPKGDDSDA